jgi:alanyl-tRNA synthetase
MDPSARLYLADPTLVDFEATIVERRSLDDGVGVVLDRTAFYPTSGGQPNDLGHLDGEPVTDVFEAEDGAIVHRLARAPAGPRVRGSVDAERRRDHVQQHSGQHLLSATVLAEHGRETLAFHLGRERSSIDLPGAPLEPAALAALERRTNELVWEARPVVARFLAPGEIASLRKPPPDAAGPLRVVEIEGWDTNACCGTHVRRTSEIGLVKLLAQEKVGKGVRLHFVCGSRALAHCDTEQRIVETLSRSLTCHPDALAERVAQLGRDARAARKDADALRARIAAYEAAEWVREAPRHGGVPLVVHGADVADAAQLGVWADALVACGAVALLGARAPRPALLFAAPAGSDVDLRPALQAAAVAIDGRGGGPPGRVQAAGTRADGLDAALAAAARSVEPSLGASRGT